MQKQRGDTDVCETIWGSTSTLVAAQGEGRGASSMGGSRLTGGSSWCTRTWWEGSGAGPSLRSGECAWGLYVDASQLCGLMLANAVYVLVSGSEVLATEMIH